MNYNCSHENILCFIGLIKNVFGFYTCLKHVLTCFGFDRSIFNFYLENNPIH